MGALNPLTMLSTIQQGVSIFEGLANSEVSYNQNVQSEDVALKQLQEQQALQQKQAMQNAELQRQQIATNTAINEENRRAALKRAVARQKRVTGQVVLPQAADLPRRFCLGCSMKRPMNWPSENVWIRSAILRWIVLWLKGTL